jgi:hypothetical protein
MVSKRRPAVRPLQARLTLAVALTVLMLQNVSFGQQGTRGSLSGSVKDQHGAAVTGASVIAKNKATGERFQAVTDKEGSFSFPSLPPGEFSVAAEATGFKRAEILSVIIEVSTPAQLNMSLEVGSVTEQVTVTGEVQQIINTETATLTNVVNPRQVQDLPLPTRNPLDLAGLQAGVAVFGTNLRGSNIDGNRGASTYISQDGINVMDNFVKTSSLFAISAPTVDGTSEFSITTGTVDSTAGGGAVQVRIITPGGTNQIHGSIFEYVRNTDFNANDFFNNQTKTPRQIDQQNRFGFAVGGPVYIPHVYNGRDKSFWFFAFDGFRQPLSITRNRTVLTQSAREGVFKYIDATGALQTVNLLGLPNVPVHSLNAMTSALLNGTPPPNNTLVGDGLNTAGFSWNSPQKSSINQFDMRIDQKLLESSKLGTHWFQFVLHRAAFATTPDTVTNGNDPPFPGGKGADQTSTRWNGSAAITSTFGGSLTNEVRYGHQRAPVGFVREAPPDSTFLVGFAGITNPQFQFLSQGRNTTVYQFTDNLSKVKGAHTLRFGADVQSITDVNFNDGGTLPRANLGQNSANSSGITAASFAKLPAGSLGTTVVTNATNVYVDVTGLLGTATQTFNVASPTSGYVPGSTFALPIRQRSLAIYGSDQWRAKPNLTLTLGLRWEFQGVPQATNNLAFLPVNGAAGLFGISGAGNLFQPGVLQGNPTTTIDFAGDKFGRPFYQNDWRDFAPFVGLAYAPSFAHGPLKWIFGSEQGQSALRGGYGITYLRDGLTVAQNILGGTTGLSTGVTNQAPTGVVNGNPPVTTPVFAAPITDAALFAATGGSDIVAAFDPHLRTPYSQQWSFGFERELTKTMAVEARYVGNHAVALYHGIDINEINIFENGFLQEFLNAQKNLAINGGTSFAASAAGTVPLPIFTTLFGSATSSLFRNATFISQLTNNNIGAMAQTLATSPSFLAGRAKLTPNFFHANPNASAARLLTNSGFSTYNAFQVEVRKRLSSGVLFQANYTWSKALTDTEGSQTDRESYRTLRNITLDKHLANFNQTHRFVANFLYELPFGPGRRWASNTFLPLRKAIEGWQLQGIWSWQSGQPFTIVSNRTTLNQQNPSENPAQLLSPDAFNLIQQNVGVFRTADGVFYINPSLLNITHNPNGTISVAFKPGLLGPPAPGQIGNFPRNALAGPRYFNVDMSMIKRTRIKERLALEFRAEFFNVFNNENFVVPSLQALGQQFVPFDDPSVGRLTVTQGNARLGQLALKFIF